MLIKGWLAGGGGEIREEDSLRIARALALDQSNLGLS
jgi:hypothetical protein